MSETRNQQSVEFERKKEFYMDKAMTDGKLPSPIDLSIDKAIPLKLLENLEWTDLDKCPTRVKLTNSGQSVVVTAQWPSGRPSLAGGLLLDKYVLSQVHFHWGSEHQVDGCAFPLEMHVLLYKACYHSQGEALARPDGLLVVAYLAVLAGASSPGLHRLCSHLQAVRQPHSSASVPVDLVSSLLVPFTDNYLTYWGSISGACSHTMLWTVCRDPLTVTSQDLLAFRSLQDSIGRPMTTTCGGTHPASGRTVFYVNPSQRNSMGDQVYKDDQLTSSLLDKDMEVPNHSECGRPMSPPRTPPITEIKEIIVNEKRSQTFIKNCDKELIGKKPFDIMPGTEDVKHRDEACEMGTPDPGPVGPKQEMVEQASHKLPHTPSIQKCNQHEVQERRALKPKMQSRLPVRSSKVLCALPKSITSITKPDDSYQCVQYFMKKGPVSPVPKPDYSYHGVQYSMKKGPVSPVPKPDDSSHGVQYSMKKGPVSPVPKPDDKSHGLQHSKKRGPVSTIPKPDDSSHGLKYSMKRGLVSTIPRSCS